MLPSADELLDRLDHPLRSEIDALRSIIRSIDPRVREEIKWNAPSFAIDDHFATLKLRPTSAVQVILHRGAKVKRDGLRMEIDDPAGLLTWAADDRCFATFRSVADIDQASDAFRSILRSWIAQTSPRLA